VLQEAGQPGDDGRVADVVDILQPYNSAHRRADELLCLGCSTLRLCIARRYPSQNILRGSYGAGMPAPLHNIATKSAR
jgi:hypothetical protein